MLRLTPRNHDGQYVVNWRIDVSQRLPGSHQHEDAFGNITHIFTADGPFDELTVHGRRRGRDAGHRTASSRGTRRAFSADALFLRETQLTDADAAIIELRRAAVRATPASDTLRLLHALMMPQSPSIDLRHRSDPCRHHRGAKPSRSSAASARTSPTSSSPRARHLGIPARYVSGYFCTASDDVTAQDAGHAWAEAYVPTSSAGSASIRPTAICTDRRPCPRRRRARLSRRRAGARHALWRRRRDAVRSPSTSTRPAGRTRAERMATTG